MVLAPNLTPGPPARPSGTAPPPRSIDRIKPTFLLAGAHSSPAPACSVRSDVPIASEWCHRARIPRGEHVLRSPASHPRPPRGHRDLCPTPRDSSPFTSRHNSHDFHGGPASHPRRLDEAPFATITIRSKLQKAPRLSLPVMRHTSGLFHRPVPEIVRNPASCRRETE